jgi:tRNA modification GTPase
MDTIFAVSSGQPPAAIAVLRISGPDAIPVATRLAGAVPGPRTAALRRLRDADGATLDHALVLVFPGPATATGENLVEFHCHGGRAVIAAVEAALVAAGLRRALPGEFTRRALEHGRIDLAQAEGLADLLEAETEAARLAAIGAAEGRISQMVGDWLDRLGMASARIELLLDFSDEGEVADEPLLVEAVRDEIVQLARDIGMVLAAPPVERLRDGIRVVLAGPPNSGKSTLLNLLAQRDVAIVSPIAGTTRDRIEAAVLRGGQAYVLTDTAGLTETDDVIEGIGVARAREAAAAADIVLWLGDDAPESPDAIALHARADAAGRGSPASGRLAVSRDDVGSIDRLWDVLAERAETLRPRTDRPALNLRQHALCEQALDEIDQPGIDPLILAEQVRRAHRLLAAIVGIDATEAMLDALFGRFCIGK